MKRRLARCLIRWASRLYPVTWRNRYAAEFDALLDDIAPSLGNVCDVLWHAIRERATTFVDECLISADVSPKPSRPPVLVSVAAHALMLSLVVLASWNYVVRMPLHVAVAPLPPPAPDPPPQMTDPRVFPQSPALYSSLPLRVSAHGEELRLYVDDGVGIKFMALPDIGATCAWRIHKITRQSVSGTARDSASASDTRQNLSATQVRQNPAGGLLTPRPSGAH